MALVVRPASWSPEDSWIVTGKDDKEKPTWKKIKKSDSSSIDTYAYEVWETIIDLIWLIND